MCIDTASKPDRHTVHSWTSKVGFVLTSVERVVPKKVLGDPDEPWRYWLKRPIEERIDAVEELRREHHGWERGSEPKFPRVVEITRES